MPSKSPRITRGALPTTCFETFFQEITRLITVQMYSRAWRAEDSIYQHSERRSETTISFDNKTMEAKPLCEEKMISYGTSTLWTIFDARASDLFLQVPNLDQSVYVFHDGGCQISHCCIIAFRLSRRLLRIKGCCLKTTFKFNRAQLKRNDIFQKCLILWHDCIDRWTYEFQTSLVALCTYFSDVTSFT